MKKLLAILLSLVMVMCLFAACDKDNDDDDDGEKRGKSSYKDVVETLIMPIEGTFTKKALKDSRPEEYWEENDLDEEWENAESVMENTREQMKAYFGGDFEVTYEITDKEQLKDDDLTEIRERLSERFNISEEDIEEVYDLTVELTYTGEDEEVNETANIKAVCIRGTWYPYSG